VGSEPPYGYNQENQSQSQPWPEQPPTSYPQSYGPEGSYPPPPAYPSQPIYPPPPYGAVVPPPAYPSQPMYGQPYGVPYPQPYAVPFPYAPPDPGAGMAVASLVLGIVSLVFTALFFCGGLFVAPITGILGIIFGILGRKSTRQHGSAIAGLIMSIIAVAITGVAIALYIVILASSSASNSSFDL